MNIAPSSKYASISYRILRQTLFYTGISAVFFGLMSAQINHLEFEKKIEQQIRFAVREKSRMESLHFSELREIHRNFIKEFTRHYTNPAEVARYVKEFEQLFIQRPDGAYEARKEVWTGDPLPAGNQYDGLDGFLDVMPTVADQTKAKAALLLLLCHQFGKTLEHYFNRGMYDNIYAVIPEGGIFDYGSENRFCDYMTTAGADKIKLRDFDWFQLGFTAPVAITRFSKVTLVPRTGKWTIVVNSSMTPLADGNQPMAVASDYLLDDLIQRMAKIDIPGSSMTVFQDDAAGTLIFHSGLMPVITASKGMASIQSEALSDLVLVRTALMQQQGSNEEVIVTTSNDLIAAMRIPDTTLVLAVHYPLSLIQSYLWMHFLLIIGSVLLVFLLQSLLIRNLMMQYIARPLTALITLMQAFGQSRKMNIKPLSHFNDEIGILAQQFQLMANRIEGILIEQDRTIQLRTAELDKAKAEAEKRAAELRALINAADETIFLMKPEGTIIMLNETTALRLKATPEQIIGRNMFDLLPPEVATSRRPLLDKVAASGQAVRFEDKRAGIYFDNTVYPIFDAYGQVKELAIFGRDITHRKYLEDALQETNLRLKLALNVSGIAIHEWNVQTNQLIWDDRLYEFWGLPSGTPLNEALFIQGIHAEDRERVLNDIPQLTQSNSNKHFIQYRVIGIQTGVERWLELHGQMLFDDHGQPLRLLGTAMDITERKQMELALQKSEQFVTAIINSLPDHIAVLDEKGVIISVNTAWNDFAKANQCPDPNCYMGSNYLEVCKAAADGGDHSMEQVLQGINNLRTGVLSRFDYEYPCDAPATPRWFTMTVLPRNDLRQGLVIIHHNITQRKLMEESLRESEQRYQQLASTDGLTGLTNRRHFFELGELEFNRAQRYVRALSVILFDVDHFKRVNDSYGHQVGDQVLRELARCCRNCLRSMDLVGRYGGEEFVLMLPETALADACRFAERLRQVVTAQIIPLTAEQSFSITISLGVATLKADIVSLDQLIELADQKLYQAKHNGRNQVAH